VLQTLSNIFNFYESIPVGDRRQQFEDNLRGVFEDMPDFVRLATTWKPDAIDGQDARYIGRVGSTPTGQFAFTLTRETGQIQAMAGTNVQSTMDWIKGPNAKVVGITDPAPLTNQGKDTYAVRIV
jgi:methyl-accepting chemotaxis protein